MEDDEEKWNEKNIHLAASLGDIIGIRCAILSDTSLANSKNKEGWTPLMYACYYGHENAVKYLITKSANKTITNVNKQTAFILSATRNNVNILRLVFEKELLNNADLFGFTPLYYAVFYSCLNNIKWLLKHNANPNFINPQTGNSLLITATQNGNQNIVETLLKKVPKVDIINKRNETATMIAKKLGHFKIAMLLEAHRDGNNLFTVLQKLSLEKYWPIMKENNIDLSKFLKMNEEDLKKIGIILLGPRRKMHLNIIRMNAQLMERMGNNNK